MTWASGDAEPSSDGQNGENTSIHLNDELLREAADLGIEPSELERLRTPEEIYQGFLSLGLLIPRWLYWGKNIEEGMQVAPELQAQQEQDLAVVKQTSFDLAIGLLPAIANRALLTIDILAPLSYSFGYFMEGAIGQGKTQEEKVEIYNDAIRWCYTTDIFIEVQENLNIGCNMEQLQVASEYRENRHYPHDTLAIVLRTLARDYVYGQENRLSDAFKRDYLEASYCLATAEAIHGFTPDWVPAMMHNIGITWYDTANEVDLKDFLDYCFKEVKTMLDVGKQVRVERQS